MGPSYKVEIRDDGVHLMWYSGPSSIRNLHVVLKDLKGGKISETSSRKITAFLIATLETGDPKKTLSKWSRKLFHGESYHISLDSELSRLNKLISDSLREKSDRSKKNAREALKTSVLKAHEHFSHDEVERIVNEALVEYVLKS